MDTADWLARRSIVVPSLKSRPMKPQPQSWQLLAMQPQNRLGTAQCVLVVDMSSLKRLVRLAGIEPATSGSTIRRSNQLSYNRTRCRLRRCVHTDNWNLIQDRPGAKARAAIRIHRANGEAVTGRNVFAERAKKKAGGGGPAFFLLRPAGGGAGLYCERREEVSLRESSSQ